MTGPVPSRLSPWHPAHLLATWFGVGLLPKAPGTRGSLAALPFAWVIQTTWGPWGLLTAAALVGLAGWWAASRYVAQSSDSDPGPVVIDEVAGQWLTLVVAPTTLWAYALGFALFRVADIAKPWPASWADRELKGGLGVMVDDGIAGIYAGAVLLIVVEVFGK